MDSLDVAILRELTQAQMILPARPGFQPSYRNIARKLSTPPSTVRNRVKKMYESGFITGSDIFPNPNLLGLKSGAYTFDVAPVLKKREVFRKLSLVEGVFFMHDCIGSLGWAVLFYESEQALQRKLELFKEIVGAEGIFSKIPYPPCPESVTQSESRLILHLLRNGFGTYWELSRELGVSVRTLQRRLSRLLKKATILSLPKMHFQAMTRCVPADLLAVFDDTEDRAAADGKVLQLGGEFILLAALWDRVAYCALILPNVGAATTLAEEVRGLENVRMARVEIVADHIDQYYVLVDFMERWMAAKGWETTHLAKSPPAS